VPKATVLAKYQEASLESEEHRKMMFSKQTWENRFEEAASFIPWAGVRTWLDVGCGTSRFFEKVIGSDCATGLQACVGKTCQPEEDRLMFAHRQCREIIRLRLGDELCEH